MRGLILQVLGGPLKGARRTSLRETTIIGRSAAAHIQIPDSRLSEQHLKMSVLDDGGIRIRDLDSSDGTYLDGERIAEDRIVEPHQKIGLGRTTLAATTADVSECGLGHDVRQRSRQWRLDTLCEQLTNGTLAEQRVAGFTRVLLETSTVPTVAATSEDVGHSILAGLHHAFVFDRAFLVVKEPEGKVRVIARRTRDKTLSAEPSRTILAQALGEGVSISTLDAQDDPRFALSTSVSDASVRTVLCAPFFRQDEPVGAIYIDTLLRNNIYEPVDLALLEAVANMTETLLDTRRLWQQLIRADQLSAIGAATAELMHEIRNPLNTIHLYASASSPETIGEEWPETSAILNGAVRLITEIIDGTLAAVRQYEIEEPDLDVNTLLESALALTRPMIKHRIELRTDLQPVPLICGVPARLIQVFLNLLGNSVNAIDGEGAIDVECRAGRSDITVTITDSGCGMKSEVLENAFTPFFTTDRARGTGFGLAVCRRIVQEHGGTIRLASAPGQGTIAVVTLPLKHSRPTAES